MKLSQTMQRNVHYARRNKLAKFGLPLFTVALVSAIPISGASAKRELANGQPGHTLKTASTSSNARKDTPPERPLTYEQQQIIDAAEQQVARLEQQLNNEMDRINQEAFAEVEEVPTFDSVESNGYAVSHNYSKADRRIAVLKAQFEQEAANLRAQAKREADAIAPASQKVAARPPAARKVTPSSAPAPTAKPKPAGKTKEL